MDMIVRLGTVHPNRGQTRKEIHRGEEADSVWQSAWDSHNSVLLDMQKFKTYCPIKGRVYAGMKSPHIRLIIDSRAQARLVRQQFRCIVWRPNISAIRIFRFDVAFFYGQNMREDASLLEINCALFS